MVNYAGFEREILHKVSLGDEAAFSKLYYHWEPQLSCFIYKITKSKEIAAEIVHDVFLKIWMTRETLTEVNNFKSFLFVVSRNLAINAFHKAMSELEKQKAIENDYVLSPDSDNELDNIRYSLIDKAIEQLPPRQREVFLLHRYEKRTYSEIAKKLHIGQESVKTHM